MPTGSGGSRRTESELRAVLPMLERHAPSADAVLRAVREGGARRAPGQLRRGPAPRRWPGWLAPAAAAAAVAGVVVGAQAISGLIGRSPAGTGPASSAGVLAEAPRYFVAIPEVPGRAVIGATATGAELGAVPPPKPYAQFTWVAAAGDGRTFVLGASPRPRAGIPQEPVPVKLYRLILGPSGQPGRLEPLPIPAEAGISGLAVSPDGSKLAVSVLPVHEQTGSKVQVFSLSAGARHEWVWPGAATIGQLAMPVSSGGLQWEADSRTLMFEVTTPARNGWPARLYLLDTAAQGSSLSASSTQIPVPADDLGWLHNNASHRITGMPLITGDGAKLVAPFYHHHAPPDVFGFTITEFSVRTGKPIRVLYQRRTRTEAGSTHVWWVNAHGTAVIATRGPVIGVQTPTTFISLPRRAQRLFVRNDGPHSTSLYRIPVW